jgi:hypothetical protein
LPWNDAEDPERIFIEDRSLWRAVRKRLRKENL